MQLSLCMIVKNEEDVLPRCLDSVKNAVDEIVIVDTGSTDTTRAIAAHYTDKIYDEPWQDDFARARNASFARAGGDYLLWLDADDVIAILEATSRAAHAICIFTRSGTRRSRSRHAICSTTGASCTITGFSQKRSPCWRRCSRARVGTSIR